MQEINPLRITEFTAQLSTKYLIIIFMNEIPVIQFETQAGKQNIEQPKIAAEGSVRSAFKGKVMEMKWILTYDAKASTGIKIQLIIFDVDKPGLDLLSADGRTKINSTDTDIIEFPVFLKNADKVAEQIAVEFLKRLKGEGNAKS
jgi:hypothetical protein